MITTVRHRSFSPVLSQTVLLSVVGAVTIAAFTQIRIPLWFTPVPITGQTFAVMMWPLLFGRRIGVGAVLTYLLAGILGAPVFSGFTALPALWGPTSGYLLGFIGAALVMRTTRDDWKVVLASILAAIAIIHTCGAIVLGLFTGYHNVWEMGVEPFLLIDALKTAALMGIVGISVWTRRN